MRYVCILLILMGLSCCSAPRGPIGFWSRNRLNNRKERQGPWVTYFDSARTYLLSRGHYRHDLPRGRWRYYDAHGRVYQADHYLSYSELRIRLYHPNGKLKARGQARIDTSATEIHYYWQGRWQVFDSTGQASGWELYDRGRRLAQTTTGRQVN